MLPELVHLPGGSFRMGSEQFYSEEAPVHDMPVAPFSIDHHPLTNAQSAAVVGPTDCATGRSARLAAVVDVGAGGVLEPTFRPRVVGRRPGRTPSSSGGLPRRRR